MAGGWFDNFSQTIEITNKNWVQPGLFWHMNCGKNSMARKMSESKFSQGIGVQAEVTNRRPTLQVAPYWVPFHSQTRIQPPKRRLEIAIEVKIGVEVPHPVKIIHTV